MGNEDFEKIFHKLRGKTKLTFSEFLRGNEGGLKIDSLQSAGISFFDIRYRVLKKDAKVYAVRPRAGGYISLYGLNVETLQSVIRECSPKVDEDSDSSDSIACIGVYEIKDDIYVMQIREDVAREICALWAMSEKKENADDDESDTTNYRELLTRSNPHFKNFVDYCFTYSQLPRHAEGVVYTRQSNSYELLVPGVFNCAVHYLRTMQEFVLTRKSISKLTVDSEGYLRISAPTEEPTHVALDSVEGYAKVRDNVFKDSSTDGKDAVQSYHDRLPSAEEYNDYKADDHSLDYESIEIRPLPQDSPTHSPRPDQPPPPPPTNAPDPLYSTINKPGKKPTPKSRSMSVDQVDASTPTSAKPPRPPPLDTMPNSDSESPATSSTPKPSRPSAPPKVQRSKMHSMDTGMGSSGNVSLDEKDEALVPPPRASQKAKGRQKTENSTQL